MKRALLTIALLALAVGARAEDRAISSVRSSVVTLCGDNGDGTCTLGGAGLDVSGSTVNLGSIGTAATDARLQCIAPAASTKSAYSAVSNSSTTVDAGCTGNVALYAKATNLSRTYDLGFTGPDGGSGRIPPGGTEFFCKAGSATADSITFDATCDTCAAGRVSITAGCAQ
jgi:hypothetical protein